jgi:hypothetical protein
MSDRRCSNYISLYVEEAARRAGLPSVIAGKSCDEASPCWRIPSRTRTGDYAFAENLALPGVQSSRIRTRQRLPVVRRTQWSHRSADSPQRAEVAPSEMVANLTGRGGGVRDRRDLLLLSDLAAALQIVELLIARLRRPQYCSPTPVARQTECAIQSTRNSLSYKGYELALVAQGIEQRFPKPLVARSNRAGGIRFTSIRVAGCTWVQLASFARIARPVR